MTTQLQPGTLVERIGHHTFTPPVGTRAWVVEVRPLPDKCFCPQCGTVLEGALILSGLVGHPDAIGWCPHHWHPVGGDFEEAKRTVEVGV